MRQSQIFTKTRKDAPKDEISKNAELLVRAGFIHKEMAGVYSYLPLGLKVINKIVDLIRFEMTSLGGQEVSLSALQEKAIWEKTNRWSDEAVDIWFKTNLKNKTELGLAPTHEEPLTNLLKDHINSYKDLPKYIFQFQTKFRNETRAKSGLLRTREFLMKDLYSFSATKASHDSFYEKIRLSYKRIFDRVGIGDITYLTYASGASFSKYSHEFQTIASSGEDVIYVDKKKNIAVNREVLTDEVLKDLDIKKADIKEEKAIEIGNIFNLGTRFSEALGLNYLNEKGEQLPIIMGSYGIGPGRLMGTVVEVLSDNKGMVWPEAIAPFKVHLIEIADKSGQAKKIAENLYSKLTKTGFEVLYDDREIRPGEKFADADLIGIPLRVVVSEKTIQADGLEMKRRNSDESNIISESKLIEILAVSTA